MYDSLEELYQISCTVDEYGGTRLVRQDRKLEAALSNSQANGLPPISVSPLAGQHLTIQAQLIGAKSVLEIGTLGGYSSICFAQAGAQVTSIEINPKHREIALKNTEGLDVDIILGEAMDVLAKLTEEGRKFDLVFIDADWDAQWDYFNWAVKLTRTKGAILVDNVVRALLEGGKLQDGNNLLDQVGKDGRVTATLVPTLSSHKNKVQEMLDGFLLAVVKGS